MPADHRSLASCFGHPPAGAPFCVAYSGGADSTALLHLAHAARLPGLFAVHVHHGLQAAADDWAAHCQRECQRLGVPLQIHRVRVNADDPAGPEAAARSARYAALQAALPTGGVLMTAHHRDDQAETLLLRLLRGGGVEGLAAMRPLRRLGQGWLWRPLLDTPRDALRDWCDTHAVPVVHDPHNADPRYARARLRHTVMPLLHRDWPTAAQTLARAAWQCAEAADVLAELAAADVHRCAHPQAGALAIPLVQALSPARQRLAVRHWLRARNLPLPSAAVLAQLAPTVLSAAAAASPLLSWPGAEIRRYRDALWASPPLPPPPSPDLRLPWDGRAPLQLPPGCGRLHGSGPVRALHLRFHQTGVQLQPAGEVHRRSLKELCQRAGLPPWVRPRLPLIYSGDELLSIAGRWNTAAADAAGMQAAWQAPGLPGAVADAP